jgi:hypothetical protein
MSSVNILVGQADWPGAGRRFYATFISDETGCAFGPVMGEELDITAKLAWQRAYDFLEFLETEEHRTDIASMENHVLLSLYKEWVGR